VEVISPRAVFSFPARKEESSLNEEKSFRGWRQAAFDWVPADLYSLALPETRLKST